MRGPIAYVVGCSSGFPHWHRIGAEVEIRGEYFDDAAGFYYLAADLETGVAQYVHADDLDVEPPPVSEGTPMSFSDFLARRRRERGEAPVFDDLLEGEPHPDDVEGWRESLSEPREESLATDERFPTLLPKDRCDRCGARAYVRVVVPGGLDLLFCGHHYREHEEAIVYEGGYEVLDERRRIPKGGPAL